MLSSPYSGASTPVLSSGASTPVNVAKIEALREKLARHSSAKNHQLEDQPEHDGRRSRHVSPAVRSHPSSHSASASPAYQPSSRGQESSTSDVTIAGILTVRLIGGKNLKAMESGGWFGVKTSAHSNPFCVISLGSQIARSSVVMNDLNPRWSREQFFFDIPLPPLQAAGPQTTVSPLLAKHGGLRSRPNYLFDPHNPILSVKMYHKWTKNEGRQDDTDCKKEQGDLIGEGIFDPIDLLMGKMTTADVWLSLGDNCGEVRLSADYDSKGLSPRVGDLARPVGFGSRLTDLVFPLSVVLTVHAVHGDYVLVSFLTEDEGWESTVELHRNAIFVLERSTVVTQAYGLVVRQATRVQHSTVGGIVVKAYRRLPRRYQRWAKLAMTMTKQAAYYTFEVLKQGLEEVNHEGLKAGWESLKHGAALTFDLIKEDYQVQKIGMQTVSSTSHKKEEPSKSASAVVKDGDTESSDEDEDCPAQLLCPITGAPMRDPVVAADGHTYDRPAIEKWFATHDTSPMTGVKLPTTNLFPNYSFRAMAQERRQSRIELKRKQATGELTATAAPGEDLISSAISTISEETSGVLSSPAMDQEEEKAYEGPEPSRTVLSRASTVAFEGLEDEQEESRRLDSADYSSPADQHHYLSSLSSPRLLSGSSDAIETAETKGELSAVGPDEESKATEPPASDIPRPRAESTYAFDGDSGDIDVAHQPAAPVAEE